ncbi:MAG: hypothetical protein FWH22_11490, partial [Fibromonadales bacterium]|nr:hypothetical protein [Fibromonadales bacterium]
QNYYLQISQDGHDLRQGDCYFISLWGYTNSSVTRDMQIGFQQIGGNYTAYYAEDFRCDYEECGRIPSYSNEDLLWYGIYAYITGTDSNARFYINAGYNSSSDLTITDLFIQKAATNANQILCEMGYYDW